MKYWDSCLYETIDDIKAKLKKLELSQAKTGDKLSNMRQRLRDKQVGLRDHNASFVSSPPKAAFRRKQNQVLICQLFCSLKDPMVASQVWEIVRTSCGILWNKSTNLLRTANRRKAVPSHKNPTSNLPTHLQFLGGLPRPVRHCRRIKWMGNSYTSYLSCSLPSRPCPCHLGGS